MNQNPLHRAQLSILQTLRHAPSSRYTDLREPTGLDSDIFKFHIRKLQQYGYIEKLSSGEYQLTISGKEYANNLDKTKRMLQKQPKLSVLLVVVREDPDGVSRYLLQQRTRHPHWGYTGFISGPVRWGIDAAETASKELLKQTGVSATFHTAGFCRQRDYEPNSHVLLEDKLFQVMVATGSIGDDFIAYPGGTASWMSLEELKESDKHFELTHHVAKMIEHGENYIAIDLERLAEHF